MSDSVLIETYRKHQWELLRFLTKRLNSPSLASDIAQDLYVKLLDAKAHPPIRDHRTYLFSMAANLATDHLRVETRRKEILLEVEGLVWRRIEELSPDRHAMARAELDHLKAAFAELPARARQVFHLHRFEGLTHARIAETLGIGATTVYKDLKLVIASLVEARRRFRDPGPEDPERGK